MGQQKPKDIFISYKNDGSGNQFAHRLCRDLEEMGYSVYFNTNEERAHSFPERLQLAIECCKDFILILSDGCLKQLLRHESVDWVREEILTARNHNKHIIPILMDGVELPKDAAIMPEDLRFLPYVDALTFPEQYLNSPFSILLNTLKAKCDGQDLHKDLFNSNPDFSINDDFSKTQVAAQSDDIMAMYELGQMYYYGATNASGTESKWNFEQAAYWLNRVAESSDENLRCHALSTLARMYYSGAVPREPQSYEKALHYYKLSSKKDDYSVASVGFMLREGIGCDFDYDAVLQYYRDKYQHQDDMTNMELADFLTRFGKYQEAIDLYNAMSIVSPEADYRIGMLYRKGVLTDPPKPDYIQASYYLRNAADNNHIQAAYEYGILCFRPTGRFRKDFRMAEKYLKIAADGGHPGAQYVLGYMYKYGHVRKDLSPAIEYLEKARAQSHSLSAFELASIYQQPECKNYQKAYECAKMAAAHGSPDGELILGNMLFWGRGCEPDMNKAYEMYRRAYEHGMYYASIMMKKIDQIKSSIAKD